MLTNLLLAIDKEQDLKVDERFLAVAIEKGILAGPEDAYTWSAEDKIPTRELQGTHEVVVAFNEEKKVKYRLRLGESMLLTRRVAPASGKA
jgi:hypothetical protein